MFAWKLKLQEILLVKYLDIDLFHSKNLVKDTHPTKDLDFVVRDARLQDQKNRQNSIDSLDPELNAEWKLIQSSIIASCTNAYNWAIEHGIAKEQARAVLPEGNTVSRLYMNGSIRSWIHYIELRSGNGTQKEHREIARECACQLYSVFPLIQNFISNE